ncbi:MAG: transcriptional regulator [Candidatus Melainabacteria bacterium]|jgi:DNA-binding phage protein|nr:transcriptional regulator [Candidatus Melainabacteria bacterium]
MALTRDFKETVVNRIKQDPEFAQALLDEAISLFLIGEPETARLVLRDLVNATVGFEDLSAHVGSPSKSVHRMLSERGNPNMDNLSAILAAIATVLNVSVEVTIVKKKGNGKTFKHA